MMFVAKLTVKLREVEFRLIRILSSWYFYHTKPHHVEKKRRPCRIQSPVRSSVDHLIHWICLEFILRV